MLDKIKQLKKIREIQNALEKEKMSIEDGGIKITINGKLEIENLEISDEIKREEISKAVKRAVNKALREAQIAIAKKVSQFGGGML